MSALQLPKFKTYEEEAAFWDTLDTSDFMEDDGEWLHLETPERAVRIVIVPELAAELARHAQAEGVSLETLVNTWLIEMVHKSLLASHQ